MARKMAAGQFSYGLSVPVIAPPFTFACWGKQGTVALGGVYSVLMSICSAAAGNDAFTLQRVNGELWARTLTGGGVDAYSVCTTVVPGIWQHYGAVFASSTSRLAYINGVAGTLNTTSAVPTGANLGQVCIGNLRWSNTNYSTDGNDRSVCCAGLWAAALGAEEMADLAATKHPRRVRKNDLIACWDLGGFAGEDDRDRVGGYDLSPSGPPTWEDSPPIAYPRRPKYGRGTIGGSSGPAKPVLFHSHYQQQGMRP